MTPRLGYCIVSFDPDDNSLGKFGLVVPAQQARMAKTAFVHIHNPTFRFGEDLSGKRVVCDRWASRPFNITHHDGHQYTFYVISQWAVLGVFEERHVMDRTEFKQALNDLVDEIVKSDGELSEDSEGVLIDHFGDVAEEILSTEQDEEQDA